MGRIVLALAVVLATAGVDAEPLQRLMTSQRSGGMVSIPGAPLPPVPESSVRTVIAVYEPGLAVLRLFGDRPAIARGCGYLATLYASIRETRKAEELFDEAQAILEQHGSPARDVAWVHNNHGLVQLEDGQYAAGLRSFRAAVAALAPKNAEYQEPRVVVLENLASAYCLLGDAEHAESAYLDVLELLRRMGKEGSTTHQVTRGNLALLYATIGNYSDARKILEELAGERGVRGALRFQVFNNLGYVLSRMKELSAAKARLLEAYSLASEGSEARALALTNLAAVYNLARDFERAEETGQEALRAMTALYGERSRTVAAAKANLSMTAINRGELLTADRLLAQAATTLSTQSGDEEAFSLVLGTQAIVAQKRGQRERAKELSRQALVLAKKHLEQILAFGSEAQRLAYRSQASPYDQLANLGDATLLADAALTTKGAVLESLLAERALVRKSTSPADQEQLDRIQALKVAIMEKIGRGDRDLEELERSLKKEETGLARRLTPQLRRERPRVDLARVQAALAEDQALIDIIVFQHYDDDGKLVPWYGGIVVPQQGPPVWVPIGPSAALDDRIERLVACFARGGRSVIPSGGDGEEAVPLLRELADRFWKPMAKVLPASANRIVLSPDGASSFLPWSALLEEDNTFLAERWEITQIASGRDLLRPTSATYGTTLLALADGGEDLPFSRDEVKEVAATVARHGWTANVFAGPQATERELFRHPAPGILHLATHAGQLQADDAHPVGNRLSANPMYRGYLLLGGGNDTFADWQAGATLPFSMDGILTAEEASGLDLSDTWLTVLSACDTGAGDVRAGEGILGLRRGFALAGTNHLLFSLWTINDSATAQFMKAFYDRLFETGDPTRAFQETQKAELLRWKKTNGISGAVYRAGGFVLTLSSRRGAVP